MPAADSSAIPVEATAVQAGSRVWNIVRKASPREKALARPMVEWLEGGTDHARKDRIGPAGDIEVALRVDCDGIGLNGPGGTQKGREQDRVPPRVDLDQEVCPS